MSFVQVRPRAGSGSQSLAADRTPFYGARVPDNVKLMLKAVKQLEIPVAKKIVERMSIFSAILLLYTNRRGGWTRGRWIEY